MVACYLAVVLMAYTADNPSHQKWHAQSVWWSYLLLNIAPLGMVADAYLSAINLITNPQWDAYTSLSVIFWLTVVVSLVLFVLKAGFHEPEPPIEGHPISHVHLVWGIGSILLFLINSALVIIGVGLSVTLIL